MRNFGIMRKILSILMVFAVVMASCNKNTDPSQEEMSSETRVYEFTFQADTANPGLTEAIYKVEHIGDSSGVIYNVDSLRFGTRLDSVVPIITYIANPGVVNYILPDTTIVATGTDTMDLSRGPIIMRVTATDMKTERWYDINLTVHQVDPDLYVWKRLTEHIFTPQYCETKAFYKENKLYLLVNNGLYTQLYLSTNGSQWEQIANQIPTLPTPCDVRDIVLNNNTLYYIANNHLYHSDDALNWDKIDFSETSYTLINMLMSYHNKAWCIIQDQEQLLLATIEGETIVPVTNIPEMPNGILPTHFPISDFATLEFKSSSERPRAMIVGGRSMNGEVVNSRWNIEYSTEGYRIKDFSISQPSFESLTGASIIQYNNHLVMFGGINNDLAMRSDMLYSDDEGMNWYVPDTTKNQLPDTYQSREKQTVIVDKDNNIYIIGGQSQTQTFGDVYRGFLNSINW